MECIRADFSNDWPQANIYTLADLHVGDSHAVYAEVERRINEVIQDPYGLCILNGDLMNTALKTSVSDIYGETLSPMQQIRKMVDLLRPISGKIIGITTGNHENRVYRNDGIDIMRIACRELGIEDKYSPEGILIFLRFGLRNGHDRKRDRPSAQWYTIYATHGSGGGRKEGAKAIRLADMASIVDADIYIHSHTHLPMLMKQRYYRMSPGNCSVKSVERLFVNTGAALDYGGYGQAQEFKPSSLSTPVLHLQAARKYATATL
jgi:predicted phosphodiesterase